jgi:hypothetical protein
MRGDVWLTDRVHLVDAPLDPENRQIVQVIVMPRCQPRFRLPYAWLLPACQNETAVRRDRYLLAKLQLQVIV